MNYRECLEWIQRQGYNALLIPGSSYDGCVAASRHEPICAEMQRFDERSSAEYRAKQFFVEVANNMRGEPCAFVYPYPRPSGMDSDTHVAMGGAESKVPPELRTDNVLAHLGPGYRESPYVAIGLYVTTVTLSWGRIFDAVSEPVPGPKV